MLFKGKYLGNFNAAVINPKLLDLDEAIGIYTADFVSGLYVLFKSTLIDNYGA
jgi:hypothetical protein